MNRRTFALAVSLSMAFATYAEAAGLSFQPPSLVTFLKQHNWLALPIPETKMRPGAVIQVTEVEGATPDIRWVGDLSECGIKESELNYHRGKYPLVSSGDNFSMAASGIVRLLPIFGGSVESGVVDRGVLNIEDAGGDAIDLLALSKWLEKPGNLQKLPASCMAILGQQHVYIVSEAFRVSKGSYELIDKKGATLKVSAQPPGHSTAAEAGAEVTSLGTLKVTEDMYFGVRKVKEIVAKGHVTIMLARGQRGEERPGGEPQLGGEPPFELAASHQKRERVFKELRVGRNSADNILREYFKHEARIKFDDGRYFSPEQSPSHLLNQNRLQIAPPLPPNE
jgi:hypothetical protein